MELVTTIISPTTAVLLGKGRLDASTATQLKNAVHALVDNGTRELVLDLSETIFIDSSGLSALVSALKRLNSLHGTLILAAPQAQARVTLRLTMLDKILPIFPTLESALKALYPVVEE